MLRSSGANRAISGNTVAALRRASASSLSVFQSIGPSESSIRRSIKNSLVACNIRSNLGNSSSVSRARSRSCRARRIRSSTDTNGISRPGVSPRSHPAMIAARTKTTVLKPTTLLQRIAKSVLRPSGAALETRRRSQVRPLFPPPVEHPQSVRTVERDGHRHRRRIIRPSPLNYRPPLVPNLRRPFHFPRRPTYQRQRARAPTSGCAR